MLRASLVLALGLSAVAVACSDDESAAGGPGGAGGAGTGGSSGSGGVGGTGGAATGGASGSGGKSGSGGTGGIGGGGSGGISDAGDAGSDAPSASETTFLAVDTSNRLVKFRRSALGTIESVAITGLETNELILGVDIRPATGQLYALGNSPRLYVVDPTTGAAVQVGGQITNIPGADVGTFAFDFNPIVDRIRLMDNLQENFRLNPDTAIAIADTAVTYAVGDVSEFLAPEVVGCAYLPTAPDGGTTTLYAIDLTANALTTVDPPNAGILHTVGALGVATALNWGFDILDEDGTVTAYAVIQLTGSASTLHTINLSTGAATAIGVVAGAPLVAMTATR